MKAIVLNKFGGTENFELQDIDSPLLKEGNLKIKIRAAGFNPIDYQMRKGLQKANF